MGEEVTNKKIKRHVESNLQVRGGVCESLCSEPELSWAGDLGKGRQRLFLNGQGLPFFGSGLGGCPSGGLSCTFQEGVPEKGES